MKKHKIEAEDIIGNETIKNINRLSCEIDKLDCKLKNLSEKYNIPCKGILEYLKKIEPICVNITEVGKDEEKK